MATLAVVNKALDIPGAKQALKLTHAEMVAIWLKFRNAEYRTRIQREMNYQLGGMGEMRTERGWQQPEPYTVNWPKVAEFLNGMYEKLRISDDTLKQIRHITAEELELEHISHG